MGKVASGNTILSCQITEEKKNYIERRADACHATKSIYGAAIVDFWLKSGAPPLFDNDKFTPLPRFAHIPRYSRARPAPILARRPPL